MSTDDECLAIESLRDLVIKLSDQLTDAGNELAVVKDSYGFLMLVIEVYPCSYALIFSVTYGDQATNVIQHPTSAEDHASGLSHLREREVNIKLIIHSCIDADSTQLSN